VNKVGRTLPDAHTHTQRLCPAFPIPNLCNVRLNSDPSITGGPLIIPDRSHWPFPTTLTKFGE
jgi:hypothetical protein